MNEIVQAIGWFFLGSFLVSGSVLLLVGVVKLLRKSRGPQIVGAELPVVNQGIDLSKPYDIVYGAGSNQEKLTGVRILGYLCSDRDQTTGEYMDSRWPVVELPNGRKAYLRPRSVLWLLESAS